VVVEVTVVIVEVATSIVAVVVPVVAMAVVMVMAPLGRGSSGRKGESHHCGHCEECGLHVDSFVGNTRGSAALKKRTRPPGLRPAAVELSIRDGDQLVPR
jgi:hypothetical protein